MFFFFKKQLAELKVLSYVVLVMILSIIILMFTELVKEDSKVSVRANFDDIQQPKVDLHLITSMLIIIFLYGTQYLTLNFYAEMSEKSNENYV